MLIEFRVNNYRSIKDTEKISMISSEKQHSFSAKKFDLMQSAVLYGANASGKSNILRAFSFMKDFVLNKTKVIQSVDKLPYDPFLLNTETEDSSSFFEIVFICDGNKYRYGFEADKNNVYSEWLFEDQTGKKEAKLFMRDVDDEVFYVNPERFKEGAGLKAQANQLFIWKCDQEGGIISKRIFSWFSNLNFIDAIEHRKYINETMRGLENNDSRGNILSLMKIADLGINSFDIKEEEVSQDLIDTMPPDLKEMFSESGKVKLNKVDTKTKHTKYNSKNTALENDVTFDLYQHESIGTCKFFALTAPILDTLKNGSILLVDELDASLHPLLTRKLITLFHDEKINKNNAQLLFTTHDTNLLNNSIFSREQVWLAEKDQFGSTHCTSLLEFKGIRSTENFEKNYIMGKYGAIPYLGEFEFMDVIDG